MLFAGADPGARNTGVAIMDDKRFVMWAEFADPIEAMVVIRTHAAMDPSMVMIVEAFIGSGRLNKRRIRTIEIVGYLFFACEELGLEVVRQVNQVRLPSVRLVPAAIRGKDERAAAAHVLAYRERHGV